MDLSKMQEKDFWRSDTFNKVAGKRPATLPIMSLLHKFFSRIGANQLDWITQRRWNDTISKIFQVTVSTGTLISMVIRYWFWLLCLFTFWKRHIIVTHKSHPGAKSHGEWGTQPRMIKFVCLPVASNY